MRTSGVPVLLLLLDHLFPRPRKSMSEPVRRPNVAENSRGVPFYPDVRIIARGFRRKETLPKVVFGNVMFPFKEDDF